MKQIPIKFYHNRLSNIGDFIYCLYVFEDLYRKFNLKFDLRISNAYKRNNGFCDLIAYQPYINSCDLVENEKNISEFIEFDMINKSYEDFYAQHFVNFFNETLNIECNYNEDFKLMAPNLTEKKDIEFFTNKKIVGDRNKSLDRRRKSYVIKNSNYCKGDDYYYLTGTFPFLVDCAIIKQSEHPFHATCTGITVIASLMDKQIILYYDEEMNQWPKNTTNMDYTFDDFINRYFLSKKQITLIKVDERINYETNIT